MSTFATESPVKRHGADAILGRDLLLRLRWISPIDLRSGTGLAGQLGLAGAHLGAGGSRLPLAPAFGHNGREVSDHRGVGVHREQLAAIQVADGRAGSDSLSKGRKRRVERAKNRRTVDDKFVTGAQPFDGFVVHPADFASRLDVIDQDSPVAILDARAQERVFLLFECRSRGPRSDISQ